MLSFALPIYIIRGIAHSELTIRLWYGTHDEDEENAKVGKQLWDKCGFKLTDTADLWQTFYAILSKYAI
jgi:hypothetical protein